MPHTPRAWPLRVARALLRGTLALLILFEEWGWEPLQRLLARIGRWPGLRAVEAAIARLGPHAALAVFAAPTLALLPVKLGALWLLAHDHAVLGALLIVAAKLLGTALLARLYTLTRPALMRLPWFAWLLLRWTTWKDALLAQLRASRLWRSAQVLRRQLRPHWRAWRMRARRMTSSLAASLRG